MMAYLIKSSLCLSVLYLGYLLISREKRFQLARFYLLTSLICSLLLPVFTFPIVYETGSFDPQDGVIHTVYTKITTTEPSDFHQEGLINGSDNAIFFDLIAGLYLLGCFIMLQRFVRNLYSITRMISRSEIITFSGQRLMLVDDDILPFSFGTFVFINKSEFLEKGISEHIIVHEQCHTKNLHSLDILLIEALLILFWFNPMMWVYRRSIKEVHEYIADEAVLKNNDFNTYANLLLSAASRKTAPAFASPLNFQLIKKRLEMMKQVKSSGISFCYKLSGSLLLFVIGFMLFGFELKEKSIESSGEFVVVVDASHGGSDNGGINKRLALNEKDIVLAISNELRREVDQNNITYVFTRTTDETLGLKDRVALVNKANANLVISLHLNDNADSNKQGLEVYYSTRNAEVSESEKYSRLFQNKLNISHSTNTLQTADFMMLRDVNCPSVLLELGFISNDHDAQYLNRANNQKQLANQISEIVNEISRI